MKKLGFNYTFDHYRNGKLIDTVAAENLLTDEGFAYILDAAIGGTQETDFYVVIFEDDYTPTAADTYAVPGYTECIAYDELTRQVFDRDVVAVALSVASLSNTANKASYTFSATKTIYGAGVVAAISTKGDDAGAGTLISVAALGSGNEKSMLEGDVLKVTTEIALREYSA